ncbi:ABC transporter substrate-binding protein [Georgenia alba]|uniref:ABC transporter substrate-binding protein n=1 Tax=Georgenia alba TaxID=2233858 RepID=A0ABW2Q5Q0_9MICO
MTGPAPARTALSRRGVLRLGVIGTAAAAAPALAGCARQSEDGGGLSFAQFFGPSSENAAQNAWFTQLVRDWNDQSGIEVELDYIPANEYQNGSSLQAEFSAGDGPDIFVVSSGEFLRYYNGGALVDLTPYMTGEAIDDFFPELMEARKVDGGIFALPMGGGPMAMYYHVPILEQAGYSEADLPHTWDAMLEMAERLTTAERFGVMFETTPGYYQNFTWYPFMWMAGGELPALDSGARPFAVPGTARAAELWGSAVRRGTAPRRALGTSGSDIVANLGAGYCAFQNIGMWGISAMAAGKPDLEYGIMPLPRPDEATPTVTATGGWCFAANAYGPRPEEAAEFCVWAVGSMERDSVERVASWCTSANSYLPYRRSSMRAAEEMGAFDDPGFARFRDEIFPSARSEPRVSPEMNRAISDFVQAVQLTGTDADRALEEAAANLDGIMSRYTGAPPV